MKLNTLTVDEAQLRAALTAEDGDFDFSEYDHADYDNDFYIQQINDVVSGLLNSGNATLAGVRTNVANGLPIDPLETIWMTYSADSDGTVGGYHFTYDLWGARKLSIPTRYIEWRHITGERDGIDGAVDVAYLILALCNAAIIDFNEFVAGATA